MHRDGYLQPTGDPSVTSQRKKRRLARLLHELKLKVYNIDKDRLQNSGINDKCESDSNPQLLDQIGFPYSEIRQDSKAQVSTLFLLD